MLEFLKSVDWKAVALPILFYILSAVLVGLVLPSIHKLPEVTRKFFSWLYMKEGEIKNRYAAMLLQRLSIAIRDTVLHLENTMIEDIKQKAADGVITKTEMLALLVNVKDECIKLAKEKVKLEGIFSLLTTIVFGNEEAMTKWMSQHVETQVATLPPSGLQTGTNPAAANLKKEEPKPAAKPDEAITDPAAPVVPPTAASPSV